MAIDTAAALAVIVRAILMLARAANLLASRQQMRMREVQLQATPGCRPSLLCAGGMNGWVLARKHAL